MVTRKLRFTNRSLDALPPCPTSSASKAIEYSDLETPGLKALVSKSREIVFYLRYVFGGKKRAMRIGAYPGTTIHDARQRAQESKAKLDVNIDPQDTTDRIKGMPTFREHSRAYLKFVEGYKRSANADESKLRLHLNDHFGDRRLCDITTRDIQAYHMMISKKLSQSTANRHLALLSMMFNVAIQWDILERSPTKSVKKFKEDSQKQRFLSPDEIGRLYQAMEAEDNKVAVNALKLLLLTGCRREEILKLKWDDVSLESGTLFLPDSKTGSRYVQLNAAAIKLLEGIEHVSKFVFPGHHDGENKPLNNPRKCFTRLLTAAGIEHIRLHDLRHTHASILVNQGASLFVVQKALGHSNPITSQRYSHLSDKTLRDASETVSDLINRASKAAAENADAAQTV
ncbi:tyrosine-type recombinase/integrase [Duganella sp. FT134W]|uniref:Tyrosine-type recombinase/integrase n=1 Tax=Duganella margarita TaxID=2692170 RepID=A0A7X4KJL0_9BURK|nr:site-specific integrase [Duganella margarita]MYM75457.1 tyrosine-type recombinase/integrase [Duganella margarita]